MTQENLQDNEKLALAFILKHRQVPTDSVNVVSIYQEFENLKPENDSHKLACLLALTLLTNKKLIELNIDDWNNRTYTLTKSGEEQICNLLVNLNSNSFSKMKIIDLIT